MVGGKKFRELLKAECCEDGHDIRIVAKIQVKSLVQGKGNGVIVKSSIDLGTRVPKGMVLQTSNSFLNISNTDCSTGRGLKCRASGKGEIKRIFKCNPFIICEKIAEDTVSVSNL
jgi:hypothetical protein